MPAIIAKFGGKVLARGGRFQIMEGPDKFHRFIVIEFPTLEQGVACFTSPEYDKAAAFRRGGAEKSKRSWSKACDPPSANAATGVGRPVGLKIRPTTKFGGDMLQHLKWRILPASWCSVLAAMMAMPATAQDKQPIKIGFGIAETGPLGPNGKSALLAMEIWVEETNAKGGLLRSASATHPLR